MEALDEKQPEIDEAVRQVNDLCANQPIEDDDAMMLEDTLQELNRYWNELRSAAFQKQLEWVYSFFAVCRKQQASYNHTMSQRNGIGAAVWHWNKRGRAPKFIPWKARQTSIVTLLCQFSLENGHI